MAVQQLIDWSSRRKSPFKISIMILNNVSKERQSIHSFILACFIILIVLSCGNVTTMKSSSFPASDTSNCTYNITWNPGTSDEAKKADMAALAESIKNGIICPDPAVHCFGIPKWIPVDADHTQLQIVLDCRLSDTTPVRPPAGTKPPPSRLANGTIAKVNCPE